jgi:cob(I)alamin adenosyltransferase
VKVYTKTGDKGDTGLVGGERVSKSSILINTYGEVDELNSFVGLVFSTFPKDNKVSFTSEFQLVQNTLFNLGSNLACKVEDREKFLIPNISIDSISTLENSIDKMNDDLETLKNFILPGGSLCASNCHVARSVCRRVERSLVSLSKKYDNYLPENAIVFVNRLSDYFFVMSRFVNKISGEKEIEWSK